MYVFVRVCVCVCVCVLMTSFFVLSAFGPPFTTDRGNISCLCTTLASHTEG